MFHFNIETNIEMKLALECIFMLMKNRDSHFLDVFCVMRFYLNVLFNPFLFTKSYITFKKNFVEVKEKEHFFSFLHPLFEMARLLS